MPQIIVNANVFLVEILHLWLQDDRDVAKLTRVMSLVHNTNNFWPQISVNVNVVVVKILIGLQDDRDLAKLETLVWDPNNPLQEQHIDQFLVIARYHEIPSHLDLYFILTIFFCFHESDLVGFSNGVQLVI